MNRTIRGFVGILVGLGLVFVTLAETYAALKAGEALPQFQLISTTGKSISNKSLDGPNPGVVYLFKTKKCKTCMDGLDQLKEINQKYSGDLTIVAIGKGEKDPLTQFATGMGIDFPVLPGNKALFKSLSASLLPTTLLVGPDNKLLRVIQGSGKHVAKLLTALAESQLQRNNTGVAKKLFLKASKGGDTVVARAGMAYSQLKGGDQKGAEKSFLDMSTSTDKNQAIQGKEGLAEVLFQQGKEVDALKIANEVLTQDPNRVMANLVKGKALYAKGDKKTAEKALILASSSRVGDFSWQKAEANLALGNLQMGNKKSKIALKSFKMAGEHNPYMADALSNQGVALKEMGDPEKALEVFKKLKKVHPSDRMVHALMRQAQAAIAQKQDIEHQKYIDSMVKDLVARYKGQKKPAKEGDDWTSPIGAVSILGFNNNTSNSLMGRIGLEGILKDELIRELGLRNISVVEREILDKVMEELKLGSSELANPKTKTKLGKITAAHILATGSFYDANKGSMATMRLVETETTDIFLALTKKEKAALKPSKLATVWADQIAKKVREQFPLQGRIIKVKSKEVIINLGERHAVTKDMLFNVLSEGDPIDLGDGEVVYDYKPVGQIRVSKIRKKVAYASIVSQEGAWKKKQKIIVTK